MSSTLPEQLLKAIENEYQEELRSCNELIQKYSPSQVQKAGLGLLHLKLTGTRTGLGGKCLAQLELDLNGTSGPFPAHKLRAGDLVLVQPDTGPLTAREDTAEATVFRLTDTQITLVLAEGFPTFLNARCRIIRLSNETSYQRMKAVLHELQKETSPPSLTQLLLVQQSGLAVPTPLQRITFCNPQLNPSQRAAVQFCLATPELGLIHGPPGTGKTETLVELIQHLVKRGDRVLVCGPSNLSVDNLVERLSKTPCTRLVRLGHPARISESILQYTLDMCLRHSEQGQLVQDIRKEMDAWLAKLRKIRKRQDARAVYQELAALRKELRTREKKCVATLLQSAAVVLTTLNGSAAKKLRGQHFDTVVIDEAAQALEPDCWIALRKASRVIFAGDHCQLPPTVQVTPSCLTTTLFERVVAWYPSRTCLLDEQYRMHAAIMGFPNTFFYASALRAHASAATRTLCALPVLLLLDTLGAAPDLAEEGGGSRRNPGETVLVARHIATLRAAGVRDDQIVVLTPYLAQARDLRSALPGVAVGTVDAVQGREADAVVLSLVRSNTNGDIGFLADARRLNVAVTRAKSHLCVVCDSETVVASPFCKGLIEHITELGEVQYPDVYE